MVQIAKVNQSITPVDCDVGESVPPNTDHAVSVSLPTWQSNIDYEEGAERVLTRMQTGYPRFYVHKCIERLGTEILQQYGTIDQRTLLFPTRKVAEHFKHFAVNHPDCKISSNQIQILEFAEAEDHHGDPNSSQSVSTSIFACIFPEADYSQMRKYWQHTGAGISSRRAEYAHALLKEGKLVHRKIQPSGIGSCKGPKRYQSKPSGAREKAAGEPAELVDQSHFVEERFGRNLDISQVESAKLAIRRRIAGSIPDLAEPNGNGASHVQAADQRETLRHSSEDDVYLYPCGMNAIFSAHQALLAGRGQLKSVCFGFPYIDTLKILEKFGPGCDFYGHGEQFELDDLETRLQGGEKILALFCEFPGNPLLKTPDLRRIKKLADQYDFAVVIDETIANFVNANVLPFADVVVSSLTKIFSGDSNVMGGSAVLNPASRYYSLLKEVWKRDYEDTYWAEDAIFLERNSRDVAYRVQRVNVNAEAVAELLQSHPSVKQVYYPKSSPSREHYDECRTATGGYGGLISATFHKSDDAIKFFDQLNSYKGPSLGTNFTLSCPYTILAHFNELAWAATYGVERDLVRVSIGLEETQELVATFERALACTTER
ncbi:cystathionine gamma-synthase-like protein [Microthyrium microscopicum]|uniref:cystathionine gamma-synthase n=1 Tax=Microthyrium microscopicum TaxID=703497 RepID=A0A6A6TZR4_9PEZI|nr:cystathionine gamma-synthase-like protein [Microthyrium microscopicum]